MYTYIYIHAYTHMYTYICINIHIYTYTYTHVCIYIYNYIHHFFCINCFVWYNTSVLRSWNFMKLLLDSIHITSTFCIHVTSNAQTAAPHVPRLRQCARQASHRCRWYQDIEVSSVASGVAGVDFLISLVLMVYVMQRGIHTNKYGYVNSVRL